MTGAVGIAGLIAGLLLGLLFLRPAFALRAEPSGALVLDVAPRYDPENPLQNYDKLRSLGLVGERDRDGFFLFPVQPRFALIEGAVWQVYSRLRGLEDAIKSAASLDDLKRHPALNPA